MADRLIDLTGELYDAFNRGDLEAIVGHLDPDVVLEDRDRTGKTYRGHDAYRAFMHEWLETWESYSVEVKDLSRNGDRVLVHVVQAGVGKGSGIEFSEPISQVLSFRDEKVVRFAIFLDRADAERAAGLDD